MLGMSVELTEALLSQAAGWDVMKRARAYLEQGQVLSSLLGAAAAARGGAGGRSLLPRFHGDQEPD